MWASVSSPDRFSWSSQNTRFAPKCWKQLLFYFLLRQALVSIRIQQALFSGQDGVNAVAFDTAAFEYKIDVLVGFAFKGFGV